METISYAAIISRSSGYKKSTYSRCSSELGLGPLLHRFNHYLPSILRLLLDIDIPQPSVSLVPRFLQLLLVVTDAIVAQTQEVRVLLAARHNSLAARSPHGIVRLESCGNMLWSYNAGIGQKLREDMGVLDGLAGASSLMRGRSVGSIAEDGNSRSRKR
jgi:hypothetical protein